MTDHFIVTGGAGFIGSHMVERLLNEGHSVTAIDDLSTGSLSNLQAVKSHPNFRFIQAKVSETRELAELASSARTIFHLAAAVGVELVVQSPIRTIQTNLHETEAVLEAAGQAKVVLTSTSEVYGKSQKDVFTETDDLLIGPPNLGRWSYACSKLMDEFQALAYHRERGLPVVIARLFNTVGPRQTGAFGMVLPRFIDAARQGLPIRVFGDGAQTRCFCFVHDTVEALLRLERTPAANGEVVNIGSTGKVTIVDLAKKVIALLNSSSEIVFVPYAQAYAAGFEDMRNREPNVEKLTRLTGFAPGTDLDGIILRTAAV